ncbi:hypothetical protein GH741_00475 [Aquibacillus halophilus]|uniref:Uncharacterized protein n=1 Tax=Aquibacillus halophilus TaxID=930132 RepID=A0A6A8DE05_9BACI|nr:hypothetical protein [Aquibacillus halophilus]MRH41147.1 hypothetical protein [Aquibacillus halophilus]
MSVKNNVIDFNDFKRKRNGLEKPIFDEPAKISLSNPSKPNTYGKYTVVCNFVRYDRQFLALECEDKPEKQYLIVEGILENGALTKVNPINEAEYPEIEALFKSIFSKINSGTDSTKKNYLKLASKRL